MSVRLPFKPTGEQYEDYVLSALRLLGYYVEPRLALREEGKEILELDVVATHPGSSFRTIFEVKKERFSFPNIFKLFGQMTHLGLNQGCLVSHKGADSAYKPLYEKKSAELGISVCHFVPGESNKELAPQASNLSPEETNNLASTSWFIEISRRLLIVEFGRHAKSVADEALSASLRRYYFETRASFFAKSPLDRAEALYGAYFADQMISQNAFTYQSGRASSADQNVFSDVQEGTAHYWLQGLQLLLWENRIHIIKNAADDIIARGETSLPCTNMEFGDFTVSFRDHEIPQSFEAGLKAMFESEHAAQIPVLFQSFVHLLGGFLIADSDDTAILSKLSSIPEARITEYLALLDTFFGAKNSMFLDHASGFHMLKHLPGVARGWGAFFRKQYHDEKYDKISKDGGWLLSKWHNSAVAHLKIELSDKAA